MIDRIIPRLCPLAPRLQPELLLGLILVVEWRLGFRIRTGWADIAEPEECMSP